MVGHGIDLILSAEKSDGNKAIFKEEKGVYADRNLFEFFSIPLLHGEKHDVLVEPNSIVLSRATAYKYFGQENPQGNILILNGSTALKVTGVFQDLPYNTHLDFDFVISNAALRNTWNTYTWPSTQNYVRLRDGTDFKDFEKKINAQKDMYWVEIFRGRPEAKADMFVQPLKEVAFSNKYHADYFVPKSRSRLITFSVVSIVILLMAWINYINLTLAKMARRMKEVATRK